MKFILLIMVALLILVILYVIWEYWPRPSEDVTRLRQKIRDVRRYRRRLLKIHGLTNELRERIEEWTGQAETLYQALVEVYTDPYLPDELPVDDIDGLAVSLSLRNEAIHNLHDMARQAEFGLTKAVIDLSTLYTSLRTPDVVESVADQERLAADAGESIAQVRERLEALQEVKLHVT